MSKKITFDFWKHLYADRTGNMYSSEIRDLLSLSSRPDIISFAGGNPEVRALDYNKLEKYLKRSVKIDGEYSLQYGSSEGYYPLKTKLIDIMQMENIDVVEEDMIITTGGQQAIDLIAKIFINTNDIIISEAPGYAGALNSFKSYEPRIIGVPVDEDGIMPDKLEETLLYFSDQNMQVKFIYLVPNFSNPSGVTLSLERRIKVLELAKRFHTIIIEDNPYGMLRYEGKPDSTIFALDSQNESKNVIYISTLSKILAPGFRIGWIVAPHPILEKLVLGVQSSDLCTSTFSQRVAYEYFSDPGWIENLKKFVSIYSERRDAMLAALDKYFNGIASWSKPEGGFFIWLKLEEFLSTKEILADAVGQGVAFIPGTGFYADGRGKNEARLAFCSESVENISKGISILSKIVKEKSRLYKSFK